MLPVKVKKSFPVISVLVHYISVLVHYNSMKYTTRLIRTRGPARVLVDLGLYISLYRPMFYYIRDTVLVQSWRKIDMMLIPYSVLFIYEMYLHQYTLAHSNSYLCCCLGRLILGIFASVYMSKLNYVHNRYSKERLILSSKLKKKIRKTTLSAQNYSQTCKTCKLTRCVTWFICNRHWQK